MVSHRLEQIHVFVVEKDDREHVAAYMNLRLGRLEPMIAATDEKLAELTSVAQDLVGMNPTQPMRIVRFFQREDVAEVVPVSGDEGDDPVGA